MIAYEKATKQKSTKELCVGFLLKLAYVVKGNIVMLSAK